MRGLAAASLMLGLASAANAETCVSDTFDRPYPGASEVVTRHADVPSPRFPGLWQEGRIDGYFFRIWSNDEAVLQAAARQPAWTISVVCGGEAPSCRQHTDGAPPATALTIAADLGQCLTDPGFAGLNAETTAAKVVDAPSRVADPATCGLARLPDGPSGLTLQRLLVEAGADPGPLDGFTGPRTRTAIVAVLGAFAQGLGEAEAIAALDRALCSGTG